MSELYKEKGTISENELEDKIKSYGLENGVALLIFSYGVKCDRYSQIDDAEHLLEMRIFNEEKELKIIRTSLSEKFAYRVIDDSEGEKETFDEVHYLDIDEENSSGRNYKTTGGGSIYLPIDDAERIKIRNYIIYTDIGEAQIKDFRIVKLLAKEGK